MTTDIKSLMTIAREYAATKDLLRGGAGAGTNYLRQLCDALEAMAGEVERLKDERDTAITDRFDAAADRIKAVAAERDRLKAALEEIKTKAPKSSPEMGDDYGGNFDDAWSGGWDSGFNAAANIARKALGGDA